MENQPTNQDLLEAINGLGQKITVLEESNQEILETINISFTEVEQGNKIHFEQIDKRFEQIDKRFEQIDKRFDKVDEKFADLRGDLISVLRKEDSKLGALAIKLDARKILPTADVAEILSLEPFPKTI